jgi:hypothetical protein
VIHNLTKELQSIYKKEVTNKSEINHKWPDKRMPDKEYMDEQLTASRVHGASSPKKGKLGHPSGQKVPLLAQ